METAWIDSVFMSDFTQKNALRKVESSVGRVRSHFFLVVLKGLANTLNIFLNLYLLSHKFQCLTMFLTGVHTLVVGYFECNILTANLFSLN